MKDWSLKIFSLLLAILIWFAISSGLHWRTQRAGNLFSPSVSRPFRCPVALLVSPTNLAGITVRPREVLVVVAGDEIAVRLLKTNEVRVYVALSDAAFAPGIYDLLVDLPEGLRREDLQPPHVAVEPADSR